MSDGPLKSGPSAIAKDLAIAAKTAAAELRLGAAKNAAAELRLGAAKNAAAEVAAGRGTVPTPMADPGPPTPLIPAKAGTQVFSRQLFRSGAKGLARGLSG
jgi:hypothetical protein